jgi:ribosomal protein S18 acetylase RimI-like enzyme
MLIRDAFISDAPAISNVIRPLAEKFIAVDFPPEGARALLDAAQPGAIRNYFAAGFVYDVAELNGEVIGAVGVLDGHHIFHLYIAEPFQRLGLGRRLWRRAITRCLSIDDCADITVNSSRIALGFYHKLGYRRYGPAETRTGVTSYPMRLTIPPEYCTRLSAADAFAVSTWRRLHRPASPPRRNAGALPQ